MMASTNTKVHGRVTHNLVVSRRASITRPAAAAAGNCSDGPGCAVIESAMPTSITRRR